MKSKIGTEIPDDLVALLNPDDGLEGRLGVLNSLVQPANAGELIKLAALAEEEISAFFSRYLAHPKHANDKDAKTNKGTKFSDKIKALKKVVPKLDADKTNHETHFEFLDALRALRNTAAHSSGLSMADAQKHAANPVMVQITADFPKQLWAGVTSLRDYLAALPL